MFNRAGIIMEKACLFLGEGTSSMPTLFDLVGQVDVLSKRQSYSLAHIGLSY